MGIPGGDGVINKTNRTYILYFNPLPINVK